MIFPLASAGGWLGSRVPGALGRLSLVPEKRLSEEHCLVIAHTHLSAAEVTGHGVGTVVGPGSSHSRDSALLWATRNSGRHMQT